MYRKISLILLCSIFLFTLSCQTKERTGAAVGGASGAGIGAVIGGDEHRAEGAVLGGLIGGAIGWFAGNKLDEEDQKNVYKVLEHVPDGETASWRSEEGVVYHVTPMDTWVQDGRKYRSLDIDVERAGEEDREVKRVAYKTAPDAAWQLTEQTPAAVRGEEGAYGEEREERGYYGDDEPGETWNEDDTFDDGVEKEPLPEEKDEGIFE